MGNEIAMWIAVGVTCLGGAAVLIAFLGGPIGNAIARRISGGGDPGRLEELEHRLDDLAARLDGGLPDQLAEIHERLDFTERLLARAPVERAATEPATGETSGVATPV